jgi:hypothetical protein
MQLLGTPTSIPTAVNRTAMVVVVTVMLVMVLRLRTGHLLKQ